MTADFDMTDDDHLAVGTAISVARKLVIHPQITPEQVLGLKNALFALERMPISTPGVSCEFGVSYRAGDRDISEMRYVEFRISETQFDISRGGSVYDKSVGSDSFLEPGWTIELEGYALRECDLYSLEGTVDEYLDLGGKIKVSDESDLQI